MLTFLDSYFTAETFENISIQFKLLNETKLNLHIFHKQKSVFSLLQ